MIRNCRYGFCVLLTGAMLSAAAADDVRKPGELFPPAEPLETGYLKVDARHSIFYALFGNRAGQPVFVLHGGPGFGCYPRLTQYFDPEKFLIVLHDQRGAGRSRPAGELRDNTTPHLVGDIERLRVHLGIGGKLMIFGGSWGSTLALAYAETYPDHVSGMVIRGVWTGTRAETENGYGGQHVRQFFPDAVARMEAALPHGRSDFNPQSLLEIFSGADEALSREVARAWVRYGIKVSKLHASADELETGFGEIDLLPGAKIDSYYAANRFFLEEGQLLRDAPKLREIPITIINGRYDMLCPPITAWRLHRLLPRSKLVIVEEAGHSEAEIGTAQALRAAVAEFE
jgi:proline iminopeptidase